MEPISNAVAFSTLRLPSAARQCGPPGVARASVGSTSGAYSKDASSLCLVCFVTGVAARLVQRKSRVACYYSGGRGRPSSNLSFAELEAAREAKARRERKEFDSDQAGYATRGVRAPSEAHWLREERRIFSTNHVTAGINFDKYDSIEVETEAGQGTEVAIESFQDACDKFDLHEDLVSSIDRCGYATPTPVQKHAIPAVLGGSDVLVTAQTGSGKTAAFLVPIVAAALKAGQKEFRTGPAMPTSVVMSPTRELCQQIAAEARRLCFRSSCRVVEIYGGAPSRQQLAGLAKGCELVVCTPGRLSDFLSRDFISMEEVKFLALDEADRMLDMGFEPDIRKIVEDYGMPEPAFGEDDEGRQTMMFSATFPQDIQDMALDYLHPAYYMIRIGQVGATHDDVEQRFVDSTEHWDKNGLLVDKLRELTGEKKGEIKKTIVFANQKVVVDDVARHLIKEGISAVCVHGDIDQRDRNQALQDLKAGYARVLVATDVAARGLDLPGVEHVVNFDLPSNCDDYVHRIGRTGRIGNQGIATSFVGGKEACLRSLLKLLRDSDGVNVPKWLEARAHT